MKFTVRLADRIIDIDTLYPNTGALCRDYISEGCADFSVSTAQADIDFERYNSEREAAAEGHEVYHGTDGYLETLAVYRKIAEQMVRYNTFLFHGSAVAVDGAAYLFTAKSGTGKSTHTRLWRELLGQRAVMVKDDKPLIRVADGEAMIYGTPWDGKHRLSSNTAVPLKAICVLERSPDNHIEPITGSQALPLLLQQVYRPMNAETMVKTLHLIDRLTECVSFWRLGCNMKIEAAQVAWNAMRA
jgi:hypothetical protein